MRRIREDAARLIEESGLSLADFSIESTFSVTFQKSNIEPAQTVVIGKIRGLEFTIDGDIITGFKIITDSLISWNNEENFHLCYNSEAKWSILHLEKGNDDRLHGEILPCKFSFPALIQA